MGQKVRPTGFRTGIMVDWSSRWYASKQDFAELLIEDVKVRRFVKQKYGDAGISKIKIERTREKVVVFVYAVLPDLRYEYMPQIREGNPVQLWLELGRVLRPDIQTALPSFYGHEVATVPLAVLWVALAVFLGALGYVTGRRARAMRTSPL